MTEKRKQTLKNAVFDSRARIMLENPVYALLLMCLKVVIDDNIQTVSVNENCIFFNANFLQKLYPKELDFVLIHQLYHIIHGDVWREKDLQGSDYHYACDIINNTKLINDGVAEHTYPHLGKQSYKDFEKYGLSLKPIDLYISKVISIESLSPQDQKRFLFDTDIKWSEYYDFGQYGDILIDSEKEIDESIFAKNGSEKDNKKGNDKSESDNNSDNAETFEENGKKYEKIHNESKKKWEKRVEFALKTVKGTSGAGQGLEEELQELKIDRIKKSQINWRKILNEVLSTETCDYSFTPPDRRYDDSPFFLPDFNEKEMKTKDVLFMVDTSASIRISDLTVAFSEIKGAIEQFGGKLNGKLGFFDVKVNKVVDFSTVNNIENIVPIGGGGTDFFCIFDYIKSNFSLNEFSQIIILTDGDAQFPNENAAMGIPVLWLINNMSIDPPWGMVARINVK